MPKTWIVVGASRGIGLEFVRQLAGSGERAIAAVRNLSSAEQLFEVVAQHKELITVEECDVASERSIEAFATRIQAAISFSSFTDHLTTNTIGPILTAQKLLSLTPTPSSQPGKLIFISSDSGSATLFRGHEDGFAAYAASKAALNQMLRHMAEEIRRKVGRSVVLAMHPGEVETDMANVPLGWEVEGIIQPQESVEGMLRVIAEKGEEDSGTFWCWDGRSHPW
ncbi:NAD(P)-binding protein [Aspergillus germanicus]